MFQWDRTKSRNRLGNRSKNGLIKLRFVALGRSFHGCSLTSAIDTRMSMQVSPPVPLCMASKALQINKIRYEASWSRSQK